MKRLINWKITLIILLLSSYIADAVELASIEGVIKDAENIPLPGVEITLLAEDEPSFKLYTITNNEGKFSFKNLKSGKYLLNTALMGFESIIRKEIIIKKQEVVKLEIVLELKTTARESVIVKPEVMAMNAKITAPAQELIQKEFSNVPLQTKKFQEALPLIPSVVRGPDGQINMNGARAYENVLLVNGANVTDPVTGEFAMEIPIEAIESIQIYTNSYSAEYGKYTGGIVNVSTLSGYNQWKIKFNDFIPRPRFRHHTIAGIESLTPRLVISGPLVSSKLFLSQSLNYNFIRTTLYDLKIANNESIYKNFNFLTQLDYLANEHNRFKFTLSFFPQSTSNLGLNQFHPAETSPLQKQFGWNIGFFWQNTSDKGALSETIFSYKKFNSKILPDSECPMIITPEGISGNYFNKQWQDSRRLSFIQNYTFPAYQLKGEHNSKIGLEIDYISYTGESINYPIFVLNEDGSINRKILFPPTGNLGQNTTELTLFFQDNWIINSNITFDLGIRLDKNFLLEQFNLQPRIAFSILPFNNKSTLIRGGVGIFYDKLPLNAADFLSLASRTEYYYSDNELYDTINYKPRILNNLKNPYNLAYNIELDQKIKNNWLLRINYTEKKGKDRLIVEPEHIFFNEYFLILSNKGKSFYRALEFTTKYEFRKSFIIFSYTRSLAKGDLNDFKRFFGYLQEPIIRPNYYSYLPFNNPNRIIIWGIFQLPLEINFSPIFEYHTGFPFSVIDENQNYAGKINSYRYPDFIQLDVRITKNFKIKNYTAQLGFKIFNLLNNFNPRDVNLNISSADFGKFYNNILPRQIRGVLEILF